MNSRKLFIDYFYSEFKLDRKDLHIIDMLTHFSIPLQKIKTYLPMKDEHFVRRIDSIMKSLRLKSMDELTETVINHKLKVLMREGKSSIPLKMFILDDEPGTPQLIARVFTRHHWETHCFTEPTDDLIKQIKKDEIDLIVSDIRMPHYDGIKFTKNIRATELDQPTIILITAGSKYTTEDIMTAGANALVPKPFHNNDLFETTMKTLAANQTFFKPRDLRMRAELNIVLDGVTITKTADISTQGMFVALDDFKQINIGNIVKFELTLPGVGVISGSCLAKWIRLQELPNMPAGLGTLFSDLSTEDKSLIEAYIEYP